MSGDDIKNLIIGMAIAAALIFVTWAFVDRGKVPAYPPAQPQQMMCCMGGGGGVGDARHAWEGYDFPGVPVPPGDSEYFCTTYTDYGGTHPVLVDKGGAWVSSDQGPGRSGGNPFDQYGVKEQGPGRSGGNPFVGFAGEAGANLLTDEELEDEERAAPVPTCGEREPGQFFCAVENGKPKVVNSSGQTVVAETYCEGA